MTYKKGELHIGGVECLDDNCFAFHDTEPGLIYLPHSCDEWEIGTVEEAKLLIQDLQAAIEKIEKGI